MVFNTWEAVSGDAGSSDINMVWSNHMRYQQHLQTPLQSLAKAWIWWGINQNKNAVDLTHSLEFWDPYLLDHFNLNVWQVVNAKPLSHTSCGLMGLDFSTNSIWCEAWDICGTFSRHELYRNEPVLNINSDGLTAVSKVDFGHLRSGFGFRCPRMVTSCL